MKFGNREIKDFTTPYIIAEIGANHNGDMEIAKQMIDSAKKCGCDAVKFQSWTPSSLIAKEEYDRNQTYDDSPKKHFGSLKEMVEKYYLRPEQHFELKKYCDEYLKSSHGKFSCAPMIIKLVQLRFSQQKNLRPLKA